jgi:hypothetical protein
MSQGVQDNYLETKGKFEKVLPERRDFILSEAFFCSDWAGGVMPIVAVPC